VDPLVFVYLTRPPLKALLHRLAPGSFFVVRFMEVGLFANGRQGCVTPDCGLVNGSYGILDAVPGGLHTWYACRITQIVTGFHMGLALVYARMRIFTSCAYACSSLNRACPAGRIQ
jgi:hypothetical protein